MGDARGAGRVELSARGSGKGGPPSQRRQRRDQHDPAEAKRGAGRDQTQDRRSLPAQSEIDASRITVEANGGEVILKGTVRSWAERQEAERAAWQAPGVTSGVYHITIAV